MALGDLYAKCRKCYHVWLVAKTPMRLDLCAKVAKRAACPMCGDLKPLVAKDADVKAALAVASEKGTEAKND